MIKQAIVVATHPEDHSVDLVVLEDGTRITGAQVMTGNGSARTGFFDMPEVPKRKNKWDITERTDQDQYALVGYVGKNPVVLGFLYPQVNQITRKSGKTATYRHQSDVEVSIGEKGAISVKHPGGFSLEVGTPDASGLAPDGTSDSSKVDRNTGEATDLRIKIGGGASLDFHVSKDGQVTITAAKGGVLQFAEELRLKAPKIVLETPNTELTGAQKVANDVEVGGNVAVPAGDVVASDVSLVNHEHADTMPGPGTTGKPIPGS